MDLLEPIIELGETGYVDNVGFIYQRPEMEEMAVVQVVDFSGSNMTIPMHFRIVKQKGDDLITDLCRISLLESKYIEGYNETMRLSDKEKFSLVSLLHSSLRLPLMCFTHPGQFYNNCTSWDYIWNLYDNYIIANGGSPHFFDDRSIYTIPDYSNLPL